MSDPRPSVLVVDDEPQIVKLVEEYLASQDYECISFTDPVEAIKHIEENTLDLVLTDMKMGKASGMDVLNAACTPDPSGTMVIIMTAYPTVENAIEALKSGAENYILKPFSLDTFGHVIRVSLEKQRLARENISLKESLALYRASEALEAPLELSDYLGMVIDVAVGELEGDSAQLILLEGSGDVRKVELSIGRSVVGVTGSLGDVEMLRLAGSLSEEGGALVIADYEGYGPLMALPLRAGGELVGLLAVQRQPGGQAFTPAQAKALTIIGSGAAVAVKNARLYNSLQEQYLGAVRALVAAVEAKDPYTRGHSEKVAYYGQLLAADMEADQELIDGMRVVGLLHDAGKIGVPESVLLKKGSLNEEEYEVIKGHVITSVRIVEPLSLSDTVIRAIHEHHERLDGSGYPNGLAGEEISLAGRMIAVVDTYEAMTSDRVYRSRMSVEDSIVTLEKLVDAGKLAGDLVEAFKGIILREREQEEQDTAEPD